MDNLPMVYTDFSKEKHFDDWPYGSKRVKCSFMVEQNKGKERAVRLTENPKGGMNKPKKMTYSSKVLFATGDDGKIYIIQDVGWAFCIIQSNMKYQHEYVNTDDPRYEILFKEFYPKVAS